MRVDLHIHTTASDGCWYPGDLIDAVQKSNVGLFAVTDHDSVGNVRQTAELSSKADLNFIKGVEFTTKFGQKICHILGYGIDPENEEIIKLCNENTARMARLNLEQMQQLIDQGLDVDINEFRTYKFERSRGGGTVTNFLIDKGYFKTFKESLKFVAKRVKWSVSDYPTPEDAVKVIRQSGGYPILAHPGSKLISDGLSDNILDELISMGIEGLECYTNYHNKDDIKRFLKYCRKNDLLITAGSDCHGPLLKERKLGHPVAHLSDLNLGPIWP